jgi:hypothetical protein
MGPIQTLQGLFGPQRLFSYILSRYLMNQTNYLREQNFHDETDQTKRKVKQRSKKPEGKTRESKII